MLSKHFNIICQILCKTIFRFELKKKLDKYIITFQLKFLIQKRKLRLSYEYKYRHVEFLVVDWFTIEETYLFVAFATVTDKIRHSIKTQWQKQPKNSVLFYLKFSIESNIRKRMVLFSLHVKGVEWVEKVKGVKRITAHFWGGKISL